LAGTGVLAVLTVLVNRLGVLDLPQPANSKLLLLIAQNSHPDFFKKRLIAASRSKIPPKNIPENSIGAS
jgi:hypothetical protein